MIDKIIDAKSVLNAHHETSQYAGLKTSPAGWNYPLRFRCSDGTLPHLLFIQQCISKRYRRMCQFEMSPCQYFWDVVKGSNDETLRT